MGLLQSCLEEEEERKSAGGREREIEIEGERERDGDEEWGAYCIAQNNSVSRRGVGGGEEAGGFTFLPLFYISIVFGQAPLYMCNYH